MHEEIEINPIELRSAEMKLQVLKAAMENRKLQVSFSEAKGSTADQILALAERLTAVQNSLAVLYGNTEKALVNTRVGFQAVDDRVANYFGTMWEIIDEKEN